MILVRIALILLLWASISDVSGQMRSGFGEILRTIVTDQKRPRIGERLYKFFLTKILASYFH